MLTQAILKERLIYSVITGKFYWVNSVASLKAGAEAGNHHHSGYRYIKINGKLYASHRLAWLYCIGEWPKHEVDHKNGIKHANYWLNLREATRSENCMNRTLFSNNTSGFKGVHWNKQHEKWVAYIRINGKRKHIGYFSNLDDASESYKKCASQIFGEFANV